MAKRVKRRGKRCPAGYRKTSAKWCTRKSASRKRSRRRVSPAPRNRRQGFIIEADGSRTYKHGPVRPGPAKGFFGLGFLGL